MVFGTELFSNVWIALTLFAFVWLFNWARGNLGSTKLAVLFALIVVYLTFYQFPELVWLAVMLFFIATFGKELLARLKLFEPEGIKEVLGKE